MRVDLAALTGSFDRALDAMADVVSRVGDDGLARRPHGEGTNAVGALVVHCDAVCEFWLGHVGLGRPSHRQREAEFDAEVSAADALALLAETARRVRADLAALDRGDGEPSEMRAFLPNGGGDDEVVLHALEELYQHLGHMELAADAIVGPRR